MSMPEFTEVELERRLADLRVSASCINQLSIWLIYHRINFQVIVSTWFKALVSASKDRKLAFMYLADDVIEHSKQKYPEYIIEFGDHMNKVLEYLVAVNLDGKTIVSICEIIKIWGRKQIFDEKRQIDIEKIWNEGIGEAALSRKRRTKKQNIQIDMPPQKRLKREGDYLDKECIKSEIYCILCQEYGHGGSEVCATCFSCGVKGHFRKDCLLEQEPIKSEYLEKDVSPANCEDNGYIYLHTDSQPKKDYCNNKISSLLDKTAKLSALKTNGDSEYIEKEIVKSEVTKPNMVSPISGSPTTKPEEEEKINVEKEKTEKRPNHLSVYSTTLWVGHLSKSVTQEDLSTLFGHYGKIVSIDVIPTRGCAFLNMNRRKDASRALRKLSGYRMRGKRLRIAWTPDKGMKDKKEYWDIDLGISYIPMNKLSPQVNMAELEEGEMFDCIIPETPKEVNPIALSETPNEVNSFPNRELNQMPSSATPNEVNQIPLSKTPNEVNSIPFMNNPILLLFEFSKKRQWPDPLFHQGFDIKNSLFTIKCTVRQPGGPGEDQNFLGTAFTATLAKSQAAAAALAYVKEEFGPDMESLEKQENKRDKVSQENEVSPHEDEIEKRAKKIEKRSALREARHHGYVERKVPRKFKSGMLRFRHKIKCGGVHINVYHKTGTVVVSLDEPHNGKTELFRRNMNLGDLQDIFADPRIGTKRGYHRLASSGATFNEDRTIANPIAFCHFQDEHLTDFFHESSKESIDSISLGCGVLGSSLIMLDTDGGTSWIGGIPKRLNKKLRSIDDDYWQPKPEIIALGSSNLFKSSDPYFVQFSDGKTQCNDLPEDLQNSINEHGSVDLITIGEDDHYYVRFKDGTEKWNLPLKLSNLLNGRNGTRSRGNPNLAETTNLSLSNNGEWVVGFADGSWRWSSNSNNAGLPGSDDSDEDEDKDTVHILNEEVCKMLQSSKRIYDFQMGSNGDFVLLYE